VFLWAGSYGTWLAFRYLHLFPTQPAGVVLEGVSPPGRGFLGYDTELDEVGRALLALCAADASCASHLGTDPAARAEATLAAVDAGHCAVLGTNADFWRTFLGTMLMYAQVRDLVPAVLYRLERCETDDSRAIAHLYHRLFDPAPAVAETEPSVSMPLFFHVALSEMWAAPRSVEEAEDAWRATIFSTALEVRLARRAPSWPVYAPDGFEATLPRYEGPLLLLQGGLDPATPARHVLGLGQTYAAAGQTTALFPRASHNLVGSTPTADGRDCAR
jgi:pimeloyl-ACP methyl ester carboxylesterase